MLIDTFVNAIYLYDDKMVITYNYKDGTDTITFGDVQTALADRGTDSAFDASTAPRRSKVRFAPTSFLGSAAPKGAIRITRTTIIRTCLRWEAGSDDLFY